MSELLIKLNDEQKVKILSDFLSSLPYVSSVQVRETEGVTSRDDDVFFAVAGIWQGRDVTQQSVRKKAWRNN